MIHDALAVESLHFALIAKDHLDGLVFPVAVSGRAVAAEGAVLQHLGVFVHEGEVQACAVLRAFQKQRLVVSRQVHGFTGIVLQAVDGDLVERYALIQQSVGVAGQVHIGDDVRVGEGVGVAFLDHDLEV
ncbi:MAG: hypothetical protein II912_08830 [Clostridia bacterium]|nr:hypothetical protein [Clostridia bacterium]